MVAEVTAGWNVFKEIFPDHWGGFTQRRARYDRPYYDALVEKRLSCGNPDQMGDIAYRCEYGGQGQHLVSMRCQSSFCLRCAQVYVDDWVAQVSKRLHDGVISRHLVLTVPDVLSTPFYQHADALLSAWMRCGVRCWDDFFSTVAHKERKGGSIVVVQTHGRHGPDKPPLPSIATSGGWPQQAQQWVHGGYVPSRMRPKTWP